MKNSKTEKEKIRKKNLIILKYATNECYTQVVDLRTSSDKNFKLDLENRVWSFKEEENIPIGNSSNPPGRGCGRYGIIGVYDKTKIEHLNSMVHNAREFTESPGLDLDD